MVEAAEAGKSIPKALRSFANYKTKMIALRSPDGTITASRKAVEKIIHEYYSDFFDSHVHLPSYEIKEDGYAVPPVLPSEIRHAISSVKNRTAPGPICCSTGSPFRNPTCHFVGEKSNSSRSGEDQIRTSEEPYASPRKHIGSALYTL
uniref:Reverse transcriptase domain-containing protein n=1 Tax=Angiostrongylus cantonensis TaxID=6313 RepID=A0A0K0DPE7_ANGCA